MLRIGGFVPFTTIDFPGVNAACVVFCQGCPWRCPYCQNKALQADGLEEGATSGVGSEGSVWKIVRAKITARKGFLDGVVFSGGEPLAQEALVDAVRTVKQLGMKVGLHTGGAYPERLRALLDERIDWVGFDIKTCFEEYDSLTGVIGSGIAARQSLDILLESAVDFECRTTVDPVFVSPQHVANIAAYLSQRGVRKYNLQRCYDKDRRPVHSQCFMDEFPTA
jgi:pyruvate formate lyase activating enzyme